MGRLHIHRTEIGQASCGASSNAVVRTDNSVSDFVDEAAVVGADGSFGWNSRCAPAVALAPLAFLDGDA